MFRPCIDIHDGKVKQIVGSTLTDDKGAVENFISNKTPAHYAMMFKEDGLTGGHVIMLGSGNEEAALAALTAYPKGLQIGGGITDKNARFYINNGASHVIVTSFIFKDGQLNRQNLEKLVDLIGKEQIVIDLSCRKKEGKYFVVTDRWQKFTSYEVNRQTLEDLSKYCDEFLIHGVDVEGKQQGIEEELLAVIADFDKVPVTYAGGIKSFEDIDKINAVGNGNIHYTVGSALDIFGGDMSYDAIVSKEKKD